MGSQCSYLKLNLSINFIFIPLKGPLKIILNWFLWILGFLRKKIQKSINPQKREKTNPRRLLGKIIIFAKKSKSLLRTFIFNPM